MQERVVDQREAERVEPSWYLLRDGQQHGPLTDHEMSLFAEGGNFKAGDLLWTAGLDGWKPAEAIFDLASTSGTDTGTKETVDAENDAEDAGPKFQPSAGADETTAFALSDDAADATFEDAVFAPTPAPSSGKGNAASEFNAELLDAVFEVAPSQAPGVHDHAEPNGEDVDAIVQALKGESPKLPFKERIVVELKKFTGIFIYLWAVFTVLFLHEWVVLSAKHIGFSFYALATINALVLGKVVLVAEHFRFAEGLRHKPLVYPIVYKTVAFTTLLFVTYVVEKVLFGWLGGNGLLASVPELGGGLVGTLALWLVFCAALLPLFAYKEIERGMGESDFRKMVWGRRRRPA